MCKLFPSSGKIFAKFYAFLMRKWVMSRFRAFWWHFLAHCRTNLVCVKFVSFCMSASPTLSWQISWSSAWWQRLKQKATKSGTTNLFGSEKHPKNLPIILYQEIFWFCVLTSGGMILWLKGNPRPSCLYSNKDFNI